MRALVFLPTFSVLAFGSTQQVTDAFLLALTNGANTIFGFRLWDEPTAQSHRDVAHIRSSQSVIRWAPIVSLVTPRLANE